MKLINKNIMSVQDYISETPLSQKLNLAAIHFLAKINMMNKNITLIGEWHNISNIYKDHFFIKNELMHDDCEIIIEAGNYEITEKINDKVKNIITFHHALNFFYSNQNSICSDTIRQLTNIFYSNVKKNTDEKYISDIKTIINNINSDIKKIDEEILYITKYIKYLNDSNESIGDITLDADKNEIIASTDTYFRLYPYPDDKNKYIFNNIINFKKIEVIEHFNKIIENKNNDIINKKKEIEIYEVKIPYEGNSIIPDNIYDLNINDINDNNIDNKIGDLLQYRKNIKDINKTTQTNKTYKDTCVYNLFDNIKKHLTEPQTNADITADIIKFNSGVVRKFYDPLAQHYNSSMETLQDFIKANQQKNIKYNNLSIYNDIIINLYF